MKKNTWRKPAALGLLVWSVAFAVSQVQAQAQEVVLASNYDGTNYSLNGYNVGSGISGYTFSWGANFTVAGTGDFSLTHITMPLSSGFGGSSPQPLDFRFAIVADVAGHPDGEVVTTFLPTAPDSTSPAEYTYDISGMVQGGSTYWITMESITPNNGNYIWYQTTGSLNGHLAERFSMGGVPTGSWSISAGNFGLDQPAFLIQGAAIVPEPGSYGLLGFGLAGLAASRYLRRKAGSASVT